MKAGWQHKTLGDLFEITSSKRVFKHEWKSDGVPFYRAREIVRLAKNGVADNELFISEEMFSQYSNKFGSPKPGDILVTGVGTLGICYLVKEGDRFYFKDGNIIWLKPTAPDVESRFIEYAFKSPLLREQIDDAIGATVGTYTIIKAKGTKVPIPPLEEQRRIVALLDEAFTGIATATANAQKNLTNARALFQSTLDAILDSRDDTWQDKRFDAICENLDGKRRPVTKRDREAGDIPYYGASGQVDSVSSFLFDEDLLLVSEDGANLLARTYPIAFSISGKAWVNNHAHVLRFKERVTQTYVELYLNSISLEPYVSGMAQPKLNQKALNGIVVPMPPLDRQREIVAAMQAMATDVEALETTYRTKLDGLAELKQSLLQNAFAGELIP